MKRIQKGFTLIELMIVVAIIGILAAVAIPAYQDYVVKAKLSKIQSTLDPLKLALGLYYQENGSFPATSITSDDLSSTGNMWDSLGIKLGQKPDVPSEVKLLTAAGTDGTDMKLTMELRNIKATDIDTKKLVLQATTGGTAITWTCDSATTDIVTPLARKYFNCAAQ